MKSYFFTLILLLCFIASIFTVSLAQQWDEWAGDPSVFFDGNMYHMWYSGVNEGGRTGYAISQDGIVWTIDTLHNPVLDMGPPGSLDAYDAGFCSVLLIGDVFHMWYSSDSHQDSDIGDKISHATSLDGIIWTKDTLNNPVLDFGLPGNWDDSGLFAPDVIYDGNTYHMWYEGWGTGPEDNRIGHAVSLDGIDWTRDELNPVLSGSSGNWDYPRVSGPEVVFDGTSYHMWYSGGGLYNWRIGYATSPDGSTWTKHENNPVLDLGAAGTWEDQYVAYCSVLFDTVTTIYKMWYSGGWAFGEGEIGYATSPDGITWTKNLDPVFTDIDDEIKMGMPSKFRLSQNYPNPFNPVTIINYELPITNDVELSIYNLLGQKVAMLVDEQQRAGSHQVEWEASGFASGVYYYRIESGEFQDVRKMILLR